MKEVERKFRLKPEQFELLVRTLMLIDKTEIRWIYDTYYEMPDQKTLRYRREETRSKFGRTTETFTLTYKGETTLDADQNKHREELETRINPGFLPAMDTLLGWLGHPVKIEIEKTRTQVENDALICADRIEGVGLFMELEGTPEGIQKALRWVEDLLGEEPALETQSYLQLAKEAQCTP